MFESGDSLRTWALLELPRGWQPAQSHTAAIHAGCAVASAVNIVEAEALGDHRREYLEYEGPVSGERGQVTRIDSGDFETIDESRKSWQVELCGEHLRGRVTLEAGPEGANSWTLELIGPA
jgi:hypothetical protein